MKYSKYQQKKVDFLKERVFDLHKQGNSTRQIEALIKGERTHAWIYEVIKLKEAENPA